MKRTLLAILALSLATVANAQLQQVVAEPYTFDDPESAQPAGTVTYRIYAEMASADDKVSAVFAVQDCHNLSVSTTTSFFNSEFGSTTGGAITAALYVVYPTVQADSWVTIGAADNSQMGAGDVTAISNIPPDPYSGVVGNGGMDTALEMQDGAWFTLATSPTSLPVGPDNRVLLGQFTTDGELSFNLNLQVFLGGDQDNRVDYVWSDGCNTPGGTLTGFEQEDPTLSQSGIQAGDPAGCTNPFADNYDPIAVDDDGSCEFSGCTDPNADNFNPVATIDDGSCGLIDCYDGDYWITFTKENFADWTLEENQDRITDNVWITRQDIQGLYNAFDQDSWPGNAIGGPSNTEWKVGGVDSAEPWETWIQAANNMPGVLLNDGAFHGLRIIDQDLYFNVYWLSFTGSNNGGGFSYTRVLDLEASGCTLTPLQYGCTDETACNFNPEANVDDESCLFPGCMVPIALNYDPSAFCPADCDFTNLGCQDMTADNYNMDAEEALDCYTFNDCGDPELMAGTGSGFTGDYAPENWSFTTETDGSLEIEDNQEILTLYGGNAEEPDEEDDFITETQLTITVTESGTFSFDWFYATIDEPGFDIAYYINGERVDLIDGGFVPLMGGGGGFLSTENGSESFMAEAGDVIGFGIDSTDDCCGLGLLTITNFAYPIDECVAGCTDPEACNFVAEATDDDGSCEFAEEFFDCEGNCLNDADDDGVCDELEIPGCTDPEACNFVAEATDDDGSCEFAEEFFDCEGNCLNDADDDGVCDELEIPGCTDPEACNFVAEATDDDGSCEFAEEFFDCEGNCLNDADDDGVCDELEIPGCTDPEACNFVAEATDDDGSCEFAEEFFDCEGNCLNDADGDGICDELEIAGCTDPEACNYDDEATDDDGSCEYVGEFAIEGEGNPEEGSTQTYTYEETPGSTYDWVVTGGTIVSGQGTSEITVEWDTPGAGSVVVVETTDAGCVGSEVTLVVTVQETINVEELLQLDVSLWPNPATESITVEPGIEGLFELRILDATGREVFRTSINGRTVVATSALSSGNYFLQLTGDRAIATERFSVVR